MTIFFSRVKALFLIVTLTAAATLFSGCGTVVTKGDPVDPSVDRPKVPSTSTKIKSTASKGSKDKARKAQF